MQKRCLLLTGTSCWRMHELRVLYQLERADERKLQYLHFICYVTLSCWFLPEIAFILLTHVSDVTCAKGLVYDECRFKLDDFCYRGFVKCIWLLFIVKQKYLRYLAFLYSAQSADSWSLPGPQERWLFLSQRPVEGWKPLRCLRFWMSLWVKYTHTYIIYNRINEILKKCWLLIVGLLFIHQIAKGPLVSPNR